MAWPNPSDQAWELNVVAPLAGLRQLQGIEDTDWAQRRTLQVGNCLDTPVWWSVADGRVYVLVGEDDEVRAVAVTIPLSTVTRSSHSPRRSPSSHSTRYIARMAQIASPLVRRGGLGRC
jgi:hypothetical protein